MFREDSLIELGVSLSGARLRFTLAKLGGLEDKALAVARHLARKV